jgi:hypothetical protein
VPAPDSDDEVEEPTSGKKRTADEAELDDDSATKKVKTVDYLVIDDDEGGQVSIDLT